MATNMENLKSGESVLQFIPDSEPLSYYTCCELPHNPRKNIYDEITIHDYSNTIYAPCH